MVSVWFCLFVNFGVQVSLCNAFLVIGAWVGAVCSNVPSDLFGRKRTLLANSLLVIAGGALGAVHMRTNRSTLIAMYAARCLTGVGVGVISCVAPVLLSEIASSLNRGTITTMHQVLIVFQWQWLNNVTLLRCYYLSFSSC